MTKQELWDQFCDRYPDFKDEDHIVKQTSRGLRKMIELAWEQGHIMGFTASMAKKTEATDAFDIFNKIMGKS